MVTLIYLALFGILILIIMGFVSNSSIESLTNIENRLFILNCPDPIYNGDVTDADIVGLRVVYNVTYTNSTSDFDGAFFDCGLDPMSGLREVEIISKPYDFTLFNAIPIGWYGYLADWISVGLEKIQVFLGLIAVFLTPANFNVLGYTLADLSGIALSIIIGIYLLAYIFIGAWLYKVISPLVGGG